MENHHHHQKTSSGEIFSFPSTPSTPQDQDSDFEFGCVTAPDSPYKTSPADHLFFNGRLLPHSFPRPPPTPPQPTIMGFSDTNINVISRTTSRASSVSSKDSFMSSRSNSTNSSRSSVSVSSARTSSSSENSERRLLYGNKVAANSTPLASKVVMQQLYGSSQRWQHIVPVPGLKREDSRRGSRNGRSVSGNYKKYDQELKKKKKKVKQGLFKRIFTSFLVACRECHAMEPPTEDDALHL